jgi:hypothetical protein
MLLRWPADTFSTKNAYENGSRTKCGARCAISNADFNCHFLQKIFAIKIQKMGFLSFCLLNLFCRNKSFSVGLFK